LLRVSSGTIFPIFIEIGSHLAEKEQNISWHSIFEIMVYIKPGAETWSRFWGGRGRRVSAEKIFFAVPPNCEIWGGRRWTHCLLEL